MTQSGPPRGVVCNDACIEFARAHLGRREVQGKSVIEVGALDVNGSIRPIVEALGPRSYLGVDVRSGPGVDRTCDVDRLVLEFGQRAFDVVISTEMLEHIRDWRTAMSNLKHVLKPEGVLLITTRSRGFHFHGYPFDFWRYEADDVEAILSDLSIEVVATDPLAPGVFVKAVKPVDFVETDTSNYPLYSIITGDVTVQLSESDIAWFRMRYLTRQMLSRVLTRAVPGSVRQRIREAVSSRPQV
jgi:SAM-dependent methyltransferase